MFSGIPQRYTLDIYRFYFEEYMLGYLLPIGGALLRVLEHFIFI